MFLRRYINTSVFSLSNDYSNNLINDFTNIQFVFYRCLMSGLSTKRKDRYRS